MATNFFKYLGIYRKLVQFSAQLEMEYRGSFLLELFVEIAFFIVTLISIGVFYSNVSQIAGWNLYQMLVLLGLNMVFSELLLGLAFIYNLRELPNKVASGSLDLILTKPLNSQFLVSLARPYFAAFPSLLSGLVVMYWGFSRGHLALSYHHLLPFLTIFLSGLVIAYSIGMLITTLCFWLVNASPLPYVAQQIIFLSKNPYSIYSGIWKYIFLTVLPLAFAVSFPTQTLLGDFNIWWSPASLILATVFLFLSHKFWLFALRHYSSASS